jgi:hypothetical protein
MRATKIGPDLYERLVDRLRHAEQYVEAARLTLDDVRELHEVAKEVNGDGEPPSQA